MSRCNLSSSPRLMALIEAIGQPLTRPPRDGYLAAGAIIVTALAFSPALFELSSRWLNQEEYSYGFLIPVVSLCLLWSRRQALRESIGQPSWCGPALILAAGVMNCMGYLSAAVVLSWIGVVIALFGNVLAIGGYSLLRASFFPIVFL